MTRHLYLWLLICLLGGPAWADVLPINNQFSYVNGADVASVYREQNGQTGERLPAPAQFVALNGRTLNAGLSPDAYWIRVPLDTRENTAHSQLVLQIDNPVLEDVAIYVNGKPHGIYPRLGTSHPFQARYVAKPELIIPLPIPTQGEYEVLMRIRTDGSLRVPFAIYSEAAFLETQFERQFLFGAYYGLIVVMCFYYLLVFHNTKEKVYLWFSCSLVAFIVVQLNVDGYLFQYVYPTQAGWGHLVFVWGIAGIYFFAFKFAREFLASAKWDPKIDRAFQVMVWVTLGLVASTLVLPMKAVLVLGVPFSTASSVLCLLAGVRACLRGNRNGYLYLLALAAVTLGSLLFLGVFLGFLPSVWWLEHILKPTSAAEVLLLGLALTQRIREMRAERLAMQEALVHSLHESNKMKDQFLAIVSHELRTPINGICSSLELISRQNNSTETQTYTELAHQAAQDITHLVDDILDATELQNQAMIVKTVQFHLRDDIAKMIRRYQARHQTENLTISHDIADDVAPFYSGGATVLFKVLKKLLDNAVKFAPNGHVQLVVMRLSTSAGYDTLRFSVVDTGPGIPPEQQQRIFEAFHQADTRFNRQHGGLGLGLSISRSILLLLNSELNIDSTPGVGSRFWFDLPVAQAQEEPKPVTAEKTDVGSPNVLVVEDNVVNQKVLIAILKKLGINAAIAENGLEAVEYVRRYPVDLVFMDCQMPVMDGLEATQRIRETVTAEALPIIAVTVNASTRDEQRCLNMGMNDFLAKPINSRAIQRMLEKWLTPLAPDR